MTGRRLVMGGVLVMVVAAAGAAAWLRPAGTPSADPSYHSRPTPDSPAPSIGTRSQEGADTENAGAIAGHLV